MDDSSVPLLNARSPPPQRRPSSRYSTVFLFSVLVFLILNFLLTAEAILSTYQAQLVDPSLAALTTDSLVKCTSWEDSPNVNANVDAHLPLSVPVPPFASWESVEFDLPIDAKGLFVLSRGSLSSGLVRVHQSPEVEDLKISVSVYYRKREALSRAKVCLVKTDNGNGVAILTPFWWIPPWRKDSLFFVVDVKLPSPKHDVHVSSFTVDVPEFMVYVGDLAGYNFDAFVLKSKNRPITVTSVTGNSVIAEGKNSKIEGSFNVTKLLMLSTTNGPIYASVEAHGNLPSKPTVVSLKTANSPLSANISLYTNSSSGTGGCFRVHAHTSNAPLAVTFPTSPPDSRLVFDGATGNAPAHVALPAAFEGGFLLRTTHFYPVLYVSPGVKDPAGRGRERRVHQHGVAGRAVIGNVSWVPPGEPPQADGDGTGWASIGTHNGPVAIIL